MGRQSLNYLAGEVRRYRTETLAATEDALPTMVTVTIPYRFNEYLLPVVTGPNNDSIIFADGGGEWQYKYMTDLLRLDARRPRVPTFLPEQLRQLDTPLQWQEWDQLLSSHPDQRLRSYLVEGIKEGFRIGFSREAKGLGQCSIRNMLSVREHPGVVDDYLAAECGQGRVLGPLKQELFPQVHPNKFGVRRREDGG